MKSLFDQQVHNEVLERINQLRSDSSRQWGKMSVGQMCAHCAAVLDTYSGTTAMPKPNIIVRLMAPMIKKMVIGPKPYPKNTATMPSWKQKEETSLEEGRARLLESLETFTDPPRKAKILAWKHPLFGQLTQEEHGWAMYKHLDHHLSQFGV